ncbi:MAG: CPBP family intramembrane metalloprotease [Thermomicrobiaceae bacterium]|nr:CPBP family intramembrane metalloprotease [Thermomicrobiaceae bacterium]
MLGTMRPAFQRLAARRGLRQGYFAGFLIYWLGWCVLVPMVALGPRRVWEIVRRRPSRPPSRLELVALALPPLLGYTGAFPRAVRQADARIALASAGLAAVNAAAEELLWRGAYDAAFPDHPVLGYLYPTAGFAAWHLAPLTVVPNRRPGGNASFVAVSAVFGLIWGRVARRTDSLHWPLASHVLTDFSGLGARVYLQQDRGA